MNTSHDAYGLQHGDVISNVRVNSKHSTAFYINSIVVFVLSFIALSAFVGFLSYDWARYFNLQSGIGARLVDFLYNYDKFPLMIILIPAIGCIIQSYKGSRYENFRDSLVVNTTFLTLILILAMYPQLSQGKIVYKLSEAMGFGLMFKVDMMSMIMLITTSILWLAASIYAHDYMAHENHRNRFFFFLSITYAAILGTVMAGDIFTLFLFFEIMTFSSYMLVTHCEHDECIEAGYSYIYMGVMGGLSILLGMILLYINTGTLEFIPLASKLQHIGFMKYVIMGLFILGFGVKAGMVPVHIWLPKAHPVAPTPASALLSGIMIKIGAYGILRVTTSYFFPAVSEVTSYKDPIWYASKNLGAVIIWMGIITMAVGVFMALQQGNMKKMLAYHSVSQMGYIIMGIGVAVYLGHKGAMGFSGSLYHIINHALFKSILFMVAGVIYLQLHDLNMYNLGGLWRKMPFTAAACLVAALGITGMPGFNGFASKSLLHHAIIEAYKYGHPSFKYAEMLFTIISAGTVCSFIKLFGFTFLGKLPEKYEKMDFTKYRIMDMAMGGLAAIIMFVGLKPDFILKKLLLPAAYSITYDVEFIAKYIEKINFFNSTDMTAMVWVYLMGAIIFALGIKFHLFHLHLPEWLRVEYLLFLPLNKLLQFIIDKMTHGHERGMEAGESMINGVSSALNVMAEEHQARSANKEGVIERLATTISIFTHRYEMSIIKSDVVIYSIILTSVLAILIIFG